MNPEKSGTPAVGGSSLRPRLFYFNTGFFTQKQVRRIIELAGYDLTVGKPGEDDLIAVWGKSPTSGRGEKVGDLTGANVVHIEDAFLRSIKPGRDGEPPMGLTIDHQRPYFDATGPSDLETHLATASFDDTAHMDRARDAIDRIKSLSLSKYNDFDLDAPLPDPGYVLIIDQTKGDASIKYGSADASSFKEMLAWAQEDHPDARILIKTHPETQGGHRDGHFTDTDFGPNIEFLDRPVPPYPLMDSARAVYTVSSGFGFEAILAGHKPVVFGQPFYAGWGLTDDRQPIDRRQRTLTRAQLFAGAMIDYPKWYDPFLDQLCELEDVLDTFEARLRAHREDKAGYVAFGMKPWKRKPLTDFFGPMRFAGSSDAVAAGISSPEYLVWASSSARKSAPEHAFKLEDGFLRSKGLGADLIAPMSLVKDRTGIYYDATTESDLERLIAASEGLPASARRRADRLRQKIVRRGLSKYNLERDTVDFDPDGREVILVPGQVADDASIKLGTSTIATNEALLSRVREDFPDAFLIYKPHPDVEADLREGMITAEKADLIASDADPIALIKRADRVATMTSLLGFEALLRDVPVTCYGSPFYAGWGLTDDQVETPGRRTARPEMAGLIYAALIAYPRYFDPMTGTPCPPEVIVERLSKSDIPKPGKVNRLTAKLQGLFAGYAHLWRK